MNNPEPLDLKEIQARVLDENTVLLEYFLGERESYLFIVSTKDLRVVELPARAALEDAACRLQGEFLDGLDLPTCYRFHHWCMAERDHHGALRSSPPDGGGSCEASGVPPTGWAARDGSSAGSTGRPQCG